MALIPASVMPHVRRFGWSGVVALAIVVVMLLGVNPISVLTGKVSPPPAPTSITGVPPADATPEMLAAYPPVVGGEAELMWRRAFYLTGSLQYPPITMRVVPDNTGFGCAMSGKDLTVFYCPETRTVFVDTSAYQRLRERHPAGADYAMAYFVAEAYGHHVQWKLAEFVDLTALKSARKDDKALSLEKQIDLQAACYAGMWTITAGIEELYDNAAVMEAVATVEGNRERAIVDLPLGRVVPEILTRASDAARKYWYGKGFAIPAGGTCALAKIVAGGQT